MQTKPIRLIVEEGGKKRAFKVTPGRLSIGSGVDAQLKLYGPQIAEHHAELEIQQDRGILHLSSDAVAVMVRGKAVHGPVELEPNVPVTIGASKLTLEMLEEAPASSPAPAATPAHSTRHNQAGQRSSTVRSRHRDE